MSYKTVEITEEDVREFLSETDIDARKRLLRSIITENPDLLEPLMSVDKSKIVMDLSKVFYENYPLENLLREEYLMDRFLSDSKPVLYFPVSIEDLEGKVIEDFLKRTKEKKEKIANKKAQEKEKREAKKVEKALEFLKGRGIPI